ncbi:excinuclease ABC subunit UvrC [Raineya orbicola]|uniref:UvrABC system protein C n=1 Tax=Raineya orbicola TaxID=2016530 RepID=A0A2N3IK60_9BACT|nr:excinuclease ABC subunit UvrC [Raineya orbicola]PKQ70725.1 uvrC: excinuclease ABC subunit C [Raineya orbicola]
MKDFKEILSELPQEAGIYKFFDANNAIIYVGKAKNLKNRVSSYFTNLQNHNRKTQRLISQIHRIEYVVVNSELDALLLENALIKEFQPKYNILLKDDKTYPYICITNEPFPKVISTRRLEREKGTYFGPYTNVRAMNELLELIRRLYTIRTCPYHLSQENIAQRKFKACLEFHIKNCKAPCEGLQSEANYLEDVEQIKKILKGNIKAVKEKLEQEMLAYAAELAFEKAQECKVKIELLQIFQEKSQVVNPNITDVMVLTITTDEENAFINFLDIQNGTILHTENQQIEKKLDETAEEIALLAILNLQEKYNSPAKEVIINIAIAENPTDLRFFTPQVGEKKKLLDLSLKNLYFAQKEHLRKQTERKQKSLESTQRILETLQKDLRLQDLPVHIECFDNSNIQGTTPVAAMVCFLNGKPSKRNYRHFNIKTVEGANDFASMYEIVFRRYKRLLEEKQPLPQLVIVDGGKGQLSAACKALQDLEIYGKMAIIGIAKKLEEIYFPDDELPLHLSKKSESLRLIQQIRDETHRFAITFHREKRSKKAFESELESIKGIGEKTMQKLLGHFKSLANIKQARFEEIASVAGKKVAELLWNSLQQKEN